MGFGAPFRAFPCNSVVPPGGGAVGFRVVSRVSRLPPPLIVHCPQRSRSTKSLYPKGNGVRGNFRAFPCNSVVPPGGGAVGFRVVLRVSRFGLQ